MSLINIRKRSLRIDTIYHEGGPKPEKPLKMGAAYVVLANPFAGRYAEDLMPFMAELRGLGEDMTSELTEALGGKDAIQAWGKGAIVGVNGELEHGAIWHEAGGWPMRAHLGGKSIVPAAKTVASAGYQLPVPLFNIHASYVRGHFNSMDVGALDAPKPNELLYTIVMATGGRIHQRLGGLRPEDISVNDGQR
ncbi:amino acid synthesis family protein [Rhizobium lusitanum]|uniref:Amino acid synthesis family protein n=1 Tax=Rhizobium lusitanum TaxID=293958 RepID=A0A6L9UHM7_9HYPH|nr:amino acid synthesis family protein [Rhizobium lusitanum]NEI73667.1 amino acid synthesis family protein [Rhizobium lusitanum]